MSGTSSNHPRRMRVLGTPWLLLVLLLAGLTASLALAELLSAGSSGRHAGPPVFDAAPTGPLADVSRSPLRWARGDPRSVGLALVDVGDPGAAEEAADVQSSCALT